jgi:hypothetical protein
MTNPLHIDVNCQSGQPSQRELSDQETADLQAAQASSAQAQAAREQALKTLQAPLRAYANNPAPSTEALHAAVRALVRHLGLA